MKLYVHNRLYCRWKLVVAAGKYEERITEIQNAISILCMVGVCVSPTSLLKQSEFKINLCSEIEGSVCTYLQEL